jgi:hypothetical protein
MSDLYVALIHYPVYDKKRDVVTTALTNIDVHDIARSCRTFDVRGFYVVTPVDALRGLARKIMRHWQDGFGKEYNPNRKQALDRVRLQASLEGVEIDIEMETGRLPALIATSAKPGEDAATFDSLRAELASAEGPYLLLLGTGWGLVDEIMDRAAHRLEPIEGVGDGYNQLSVRAAAAVLLDRLHGKR